MKSFEEQRGEETRLAKSDPGIRITMTAVAYNALQKTLDHAMAEVYASRLGEIPDAAPGKNYMNSLISACVSDTSRFDFGMSHLPYLIVKDMSEHSVNVAMAYASVHAESRLSKGSTWDLDASFGTEGRYKVLFGELTVEGARKVANSLVDYVKDQVLVTNRLAGLPYQGKITPFMTAVAGHVLIHDGHTGVTLPDDWTGICVDARDAKKHWYIGQSGGERSFSALAANNIRSAILESEWILQAERSELTAA